MFFSQVGNSEAIKQLELLNETPLSILEECYQAVYSVARFYLQQSIEPNRILSNNIPNASNKDEQKQLTDDEKYQIVFCSKVFFLFDFSIRGYYNQLI